MNLREQIALDISNVFFNPDEFTDAVNIDGQNKLVIIDDEALKARAEKEYGGITTGMILYFIPVASYGPNKPEIGAAQKFNKQLMWIQDVKGENSGVYEIILNQNRGE